MYEITTLKQLGNFVSRELYFLNRKTEAQSPKPQEVGAHMDKTLLNLGARGTGKS